jgi:crotonobetainyl-CoA:carnitine CoA-transferase CaiB-like acyl-CoA transferase
MNGPLDGIRVVEIANYIAVPAAASLLAELGADVVKVEVPWGEVYRHSTPRRNGYSNDFPTSLPYEMDNRGKRSVALDLALPQAQDVLAALIDRADIVLTNVLPGRLAKFGLDAEKLRAERPALILARVGGFAADGPQANDPGFDQTAFFALSGLMDQQRDPDSPPAFPRPGAGDHSTALALVSGVLAALRMRDQTGQGQVVDVNLQQVGLYVNGNDTSQSLVTGEIPPRHDRSAPRNPLWNFYRCSDGRWLFLVMLDSNVYWPKLLEAIDRPELASDERFADAVKRFKESRALVSILDQVFATRTLEAWTSHFEEFRVIAAPVRTVAEAAADEKARANGCFVEVDHPEFGSFPSVAPPFQLSGFQLAGTTPAPMLSQHTAEVLREAGVDEDTIEIMVAVASS